MIYNIYNMFVLNYFYVLFIELYIFQTAAFENMVSCKNCKWFTLPKGEKQEYGLCRFFTNQDTLNKDKPEFYEFADHCRKNKNLCSEEGYFFEEYLPQNSLNANIEKEFNYDKIYILETQLNELKNKVYGEVNEKNELDEIEKNIQYVREKLELIQNRMGNKNK